MNAAIRIDSITNGLLPRTESRTFEFDEELESFSVAAQDYIELLMMMNCNFNVKFMTDATEFRAAFLNKVLLKVSGYEALLEGAK